MLVATNYDTLDTKLTVHGFIWLSTGYGYGLRQFIYFYWKFYRVTNGLKMKRNMSYNEKYLEIKTINILLTNSFRHN